MCCSFAIIAAKKCVSYHAKNITEKYTLWSFMQGVIPSASALDNLATRQKGGRFALPLIFCLPHSTAIRTA
jgi:hypothetical protein